jgi:hypothetical protein
MEYVIESLDDIDVLRIPDRLEDDPAFAEQLRCFRLLRNEVGGKTPICSYISSSMTLPTMLMGMERWMELLLLGPADARDRLLAKCHEFFVREVLPHVPDAWIDTNVRDPKDGEVGKVGYEINVNRVFYEYVPPRPLEEIEADIREVEKEILAMLGQVAAPAEALKDN